MASSPPAAIVDSSAGSGSPTPGDAPRGRQEDTAATEHTLDNVDASSTASLSPPPYPDDEPEMPSDGLRSGGGLDSGAAADSGTGKTSRASPPPPSLPAVKAAGTALPPKPPAHPNSNTRARRGSGGAGGAFIAVSGAGAGVGAGAGGGVGASAGASTSNEASDAPKLIRKMSSREDVMGYLIYYFHRILPMLTIYKHGRWGAPKIREFWLDIITYAPDPMLKWDFDGRGAKKARGVRFSEIECVETGLSTKVLRRSGEPRHADLYLSLIKKKGGRSVDLQFESEILRNKAELWFNRALHSPELLYNPCAPPPTPLVPVKRNGTGTGTRNTQYMTGSAVGLVWAAQSRPGVGMTGRTKTNQDAFRVVHPFNGKPNCAVIGVFDGHGPCGEKVSQFVRDKLPEALESSLKHSPTLDAALKNACCQTHYQLCMSPYPAHTGGSTAIMSYILGDTLYTANVGDSRCYVGTIEASGRLVLNPLSTDHSPNHESEYRRIIEAGGEVRKWGVERVYEPGRQSPGLAVSRSIGDCEADHLGVIPEPDVTIHKICPGDRFFLWCSDGLTEFMFTRQVASIVGSVMNGEPTSVQAAKAIDEMIASSRRKWVREQGGVIDDITVVLAFLKRK